MTFFKNAIRRLVRYMRFAGYRYYCPLCERSAHEFTPNQASAGQDIVDTYGIVSMGRRPHYRCPWCNSSDKERLVWLFLNAKTDLLAGTQPKSVLHVAPERNTMHRLKEVPGLSYTAGDMFEGDERYSSGRYGDAVYLDITDMSQFKDGMFDAVICNHVMEHVPDDARAMREIFRVLKPGGFAVVQTPVSRIIPASIEDARADTPQKRLAAFGQIDHVRIYAEEDYCRRLAGAGFDAQALDQSSFVSKEQARRCGVNTQEKLYLAKR